MVSIIIPAHNEEAVIARCLASIVRQTGPGDEIVVVCNGCTDDTAQVARRAASNIRVAELTIASKIAALNYGDALVKQYPRLYVDADVVLGSDAVSSLVGVLKDESADLAAPAVHYDLSGSSFLVRTYYRIWAQLPSVRDDTVGRGAFGLSARGRARFVTFPDVLGDDHFVRDLIPPERRKVVRTTHSVVRAPRTLRAVLRRKTRSVTGNRALDRRTPEGRRRAAKRRIEWVVVLRQRPCLIPLAPLYVGVALVSRLVASIRRIRDVGPIWDRDTTTRR